MWGALIRWAYVGVSDKVGNASAVISWAYVGGRVMLCLCGGSDKLVLFGGSD